MHTQGPHSEAEVVWFHHTVEIIGQNESQGKNGYYHYQKPQHVHIFWSQQHDEPCLLWNSAKSDSQKCFVLFVQVLKMLWPNFYPHPSNMVSPYILVFVLAEWVSGELRSFIMRYESVLSGYCGRGSQCALRSEPLSPGWRTTQSHREKSEH